MKDILKVILAIFITVALTYLIWALFIPMAIGGKIVEREVIQQAPQYVISQRSALLKLNAAYEEAETDAQRTAIKSQLCEVAGTIPQSEVPAAVKPKLGGCL